MSTSPDQAGPNWSNSAKRRDSFWSSQHTKLRDLQGLTGSITKEECTNNTARQPLSSSQQAQPSEDQQRQRPYHERPPEERQGQAKPLTKTTWVDVDEHTAGAGAWISEAELASARTIALEIEQQRVAEQVYYQQANPGAMRRGQPRGMA